MTSRGRTRQKIGKNTVVANLGSGAQRGQPTDLRSLALALRPHLDGLSNPAPSGGSGNTSGQTSASYVLEAAGSGLPNARVLAAGTGITLTDGGAGSTLTIAAAGGSGDVVGPGSAVDGDFVQFDGTTGKLIKDGGLSLDTDGTLAADSDSRIASQKAVKTYADAISAGSAASVAAGIDKMFFGTGVDGDLSISSGTTNLSSDMFYNNVTISGTAKINLNGWRLYIAGTLDLTNAPQGAIVNTHTSLSLNGNNSGNTAGATGGSTSSVNTIGRGQSGGAGPNGGLNAGTQATAIGSSGDAVPNTAGAGGKGGNVGATAGGASRSGATGTQTLTVRKLTDQLYGFINTTFTICLNGPGAPGGSSAAGDGVGAGGGGGGGGATPGVVWVGARTIARATATTAGRAINADGGNGGNGGTGTAGTNTGGGGGGGGAPGGWVYLIYRNLTGTAKTGLVSAQGGNGGNGGAGRGTGIGGDGGSSGSRGRITIFCLADGSWTHAEHDTTTVAGSAGSGTTGGSGGAANSQAIDL